MNEQTPGGEDRRTFLQQVSVAGGALALAAAPHPKAEPGPLEMTNLGADRIPLKPLGKTGERVSVVGLCGRRLGEAGSPRQAARLVQEALEAGVTFFDNAWEYHDGRSEEWLGQALKGRRDKAFVASAVCTHGRDKDVALKQLEQSLRRLQTDHLDLWQVHEVIYENEPELAHAKGGVVEALEKANKDGKVRFVGFTGHKSPQIHLDLLGRRFDFDAVQMPLNALDASYHSFERQVLPLCRRRGVAALGVMPLGGDWAHVLHGILTAEEALAYALSLPASTTICGVDSRAALLQTLAAARGFKPLSAEKMRALRQRCAAHAADGHLELYKTSMRHDGAVGRKQHGFPPAEELPM